MRELKFHEKKLLKKVNFLAYKNEGNLRELKAMRRYHIGDRRDYVAYNRLVGLATKLTAILRTLDPSSPFRIEMTDKLLTKLYDAGAIPVKRSLAQVDGLAASAICRRRLAVVMVKLKMAETVKEATTFVQQGHVRVGPKVITDPAYLVTRSNQDYVTWVDTSAIRRKVAAYNDQLDDLDLLPA